MTGGNFSFPPYPSNGSIVMIPVPFLTRIKRNIFRLEPMKIEMSTIFTVSAIHGSGEIVQDKQQITFDDYIYEKHEKRRVQRKKNKRHSCRQTERTYFHIFLVKALNYSISHWNKRPTYYQLPSSQIKELWIMKLMFVFLAPYS